MAVVTWAVGVPCARSQMICQWLRATGSVARRYRVWSSSTERWVTKVSRRGIHLVYTRISYYPDFVRDLY